MTAALAIAEAHHRQAAAALADAEQALADAVAAAGIRLRPIRARLTNEPDAPICNVPLDPAGGWRCIEARAEADPQGVVGRAWAAWRRAERAEKKAASALRRARIDEESRAERRPAPKRRARSDVRRQRELAEALAAMRRQGREAVAA